MSDTLLTRRGRASRIGRPHFVPDRERKVWDSCVHESGHVLMGMLADVPIREVFVPKVLDWSTKNLPATSMVPLKGPAAALTYAAGNGASWSRGGRERSASPTDREGFVFALGSDDRYHEFAGAVADVFRTPELARKLERIATYVYRRQNRRIDTSVFWFKVVKLEDDARELVDAALVRLGSPFGRFGSQEEKDRREQWAADMRAAAAKKRGART